MKRLLIASFAVVLTLVIGLLYRADRAGNAQVVRAAHAGTVASSGYLTVIGESERDLSGVHLGDSISLAYELKNEGHQALRILNVRPSCGCTAAVVDSTVVAPGGVAHIKATFRTSGKDLGSFEKTIMITTNSVIAPSLKVGFHGEIVMPRKAHMGVMGLQGIFSGSCATCHADRGRGQIGQSLYTADCAICHGSQNEKQAPDLLTTPEKLDQQYLFETILNGRHGTNMPAFDWAKGGPLRAQEITTLCQYILMERSKLHSQSKPTSQYGGNTK
ncbi:MAG: DUF1573 domain-containing protein [Candidatus Micrarchaeaceae archaeon]